MIQVGWPETKQQAPHSIRQYWDMLPRHEDHNTPIQEAGNARSQTWNTPRNCKV